MTGIRNHRSILLLMIAAASGAALLGCSRHKVPSPAAGTAATAAAPATTPAPAPAAAPAPATAVTAGPATGAANAAASSGQAPAAGSAVPAPASQPTQPPDLILLAGAAMNGCTAPTPPPDPPDGRVATKAQMLAAHTLTANFNAATDDYLACLDQAASNFGRQYGRVLKLSGMRQVAVMHDRFHNRAVEADQAIAEKFNQQLRIYKARSGPG